MEIHASTLIFMWLKKNFYALMVILFNISCTQKDNKIKKMMQIRIGLSKIGEFVQTDGEFKS